MQTSKEIEYRKFAAMNEGLHCIIYRRISDSLYLLLSLITTLLWYDNWSVQGNNIQKKVKSKQSVIPLALFFNVTSPLKKQYS